MGLFSCASPDSGAFLARKAHCSIEARKLFPVQFENKLKSYAVSEDVASGEVDCNSHSFGDFIKTKCAHERTTKLHSVQKLESVDANEEKREEHAVACARRMCMKEVGNFECR